MIRHTKALAQLQADAVIGGTRTFAPWIEGRNTRWVQLLVKGTLTITAAVTSILGLGSILQVFDEIGIDENGKDQTAHPLMWFAISEFLRASAGTAVRASSTANGTYPLSETIIIPFEYIGSARPRETLFRERSPQQRTRVLYKLNGTNNGVANIVNGGTATITLVSVQAVQFFDEDPTANTPLFKPGFREAIVPVNAASSGIQLPIDLAADEVLRGVTIMQNTANRSVVGDIINKLSFRGARQDIVGRNELVDYDQFARSQEFESGGNIFATPNKALVHYNFQKSGRLAQCLNSQQDSNFKFVFDAQPSVVAGATGSEIRVLLHLLRRDPFQRIDRTLVTTKQLPPQLVSA